jgi:GH25 family lysozyme M1 (1,4-beta-N-acetylmuramidase)
MSGAASAGVITGTYLRARPDLAELTDLHSGSADDQPAAASLRAHADDEAQNFYNLVSAYLTPTHLRPVLDLEGIPGDVPQHPDTEPLTKASMTTWANEFLDHFEALSGGVEPILYVNTDYATNRLTGGINTPSRRTLWLARPYSGTYTTSSQPETPAGFSNPYGVWNNSADPSSSWQFWQYDSTGNGATYGASSTNLDLDTFNGDMTALRAFLVPEPTAGWLAVAASAMSAICLRRRGRTP